MSQIITSVDVENALTEKDEVPPTKKLKQARLPFKPLEQKPQIVSPQNAKKRKLSDAESPSAKLHKNHRQERQPSGEKPVYPDHDPEVSSSSEAEHLPVTNPNRIRNALERFVCKRSQEEISSTIDCIDLTTSEKNVDVDCMEADTCNSEERNLTVDESCTGTADSSVEDQKDDHAGVTSPGQESSTKKPSLDNATKTDDSDKCRQMPDSVATSITLGKNEVLKENQIEEKSETGGDESEECEDGEMSVDDEARKCNTEKETTSPGQEFTTPSRSSTFLDHTPISAGRPGYASTPMSQSPGDSASDSTSTPKVRNKCGRSKQLSEAKRKEREAQRQRIKEERERIMEEKKKKKDQERLEKEKMKEEKKKEKEEEKAEKERLKKEEKEKKEKERLEKLQIKEEEKKKKQEILEAKQEEKRKKEEEMKQKKEEKQREEEEKQKKEQKEKAVFQSFFKKTSPVSKPTKEPEGMFMPFEVKKDMKLAPSCNRDNLDEEGMSSLDKHLIEQTCDELYLKELISKKHLPKKTSKTNSEKSADDDVIMVHDSETVKKVTYHCKLLQFHMNYRPPYYGTWRKTSKILNSKNPWKQDTDLFDYEVDSDDEWEEEEPGESLSASEGEDEKEDEKDDEDEDGWMVPHGYLSEGEGCEEDEEVTPEVMKARRTARAEAWESEMKRQTQPALPVIIGCVWQQGLHSIQQQLQSTLQNFKAVALTSTPIPTTYNGATLRKLDNSPSEKQYLNTRKPVPEEAMPYLIRLVHGNLAGIKKLIKEFRLFWKQKICGDVDNAENQADASMEVEDSDSLKRSETEDKSVAMEIDEVANEVEGCCISKRQLELKISSIAVREKRSTFKKVCWYVHDKLLEQYGLQDLPVPSAWEFISQPGKTPNKPKPDDIITSPAGRKTPTVSITQFARPMSPSQIAAQQKAVALRQAKEAAEAKRVAEAKQAALMAAAAEKQAAAALERQAAMLAEANKRMSPAVAIVVENGVVKKAVVDQKSISMFAKKINSTPPVVSSSISCQSSLNVKPIAQLPAQKSGGQGTPQAATTSAGQSTSSKTTPQPQKKRIVPIILSSLVQGGQQQTEKKSNIIETTAVIEPIPFSVKGKKTTVNSPPRSDSGCNTQQNAAVAKKTEQFKLIQKGDHFDDAIVID